MMSFILRAREEADGFDIAEILAGMSSGEGPASELTPRKI
jgi:hypothetical protein